MDRKNKRILQTTLIIVVVLGIIVSLYLYAGQRTLLAQSFLGLPWARFSSWSLPA